MSTYWDTSIVDNDRNEAESARNDQDHGGNVYVGGKGYDAADIEWDE